MTARLLEFAEDAVVQTLVRVTQQCGAFAAEFCAVTIVVVAAVDTDHRRDRPFLAAYAPPAIRGAHRTLHVLLGGWGEALDRHLHATIIGKPHRFGLIIVNKI